MKTVRPLFVSTFPPEVCGVATFTHGLADAIGLVSGAAVSSVMMIRKTQPLASDPRIVHIIENDRPGDYRLAADVANGVACDMISLQHEFGLYAGPWGSQIIEFLNGCRKPIVTTFHTLMTEPEPMPRRLIREMAVLSQGVVVATNVAAELLREVYGVSGQKVRVIPHAVPVSLKVARQYLEVFDQVVAVREQRLERRFLDAFVPRVGY